MFHIQTTRQCRMLSLLFRLGTPGLTSQARARLCTRPCETDTVKLRNVPWLANATVQRAKLRRFVHLWCWVVEGRERHKFWKDTCVDSDFIYTSLETLMQTWAMQTWARNMLSQSWASLVLRHLTLLTVPHKPLCTAQDTYVPHPNHSAMQNVIAHFSIGDAGPDISPT